MAANQTADDIETLVETTAESAYPRSVKDADAYAVVDDGEFAHVQAVWRVDDTTVRTVSFYCEAGLCEIPAVEIGGTGEEHFDVSADKSTEDWAREAANVDPAASIDGARFHFDAEVSE